MKYHTKYLIRILKDIKNNTWVTVNNDFGVMSEALWQQFSLVTKPQVKIISKRFMSDPKSLFTAMNVLFYFLQAILRPEHTIPLKTLSIAGFAIVAKDGLFDLVSDQLWWRHTNVGYWHCAIIFIDGSFMCKLVQRRSSQVNNNRAYQFLTTRYSRLTM